ncbi:Glutathione import ATP-binding protein GsiA [Achromobacter spanius]|uniref:ABC transporter ATP-binding protein n=1 Tax=Achromobacter spanius TaxID=217203 RepID=UPI000C2BA104|nr:ABC transporter ATP-binding protein [Achromobacter spanius]AUA59043.1 ABC transporter ATP-binding protein [Achromobacter spanius]CAB3661332.1 Glutathione import ATP-binding protein GsiA [Achromobacter spanius]SPT40460.1 Glutathione import ATP-binding protein GsiA [Achromobacter denitrificans]VEE58783.1 Glutathione import ATP-binding protein GsiA [Achromobacter spanius]
MSETLLAVQGLSVEFGARAKPYRAVKALDFTIGRGETVALVGESGSGKSVTALSLLRLIERAGGRIASGAARFVPRDGQEVDLFKLPESALRRIRGNEISMIFQEPMTSLNPVMTVGDQLAEVYLLHQDISREQAWTKAEAMLVAVKMSEPQRRMTQYPGDLSGGMRQRVMIAMALACRPQLLIADEPTTALDVTVQAEIIDLIRDLQRDVGMAVLFITHDMGVVAEIADRVVVMRHGDKVEENITEALFDAPQQPYTRDLLAAVPKLGDGSPDEAVLQDRPTVLEVSGLAKRFPVKSGAFGKVVANVHAVEGVSFTLRAGETLALVGESGSGKSTTGRLLMKLVQPTEGVIRLVGQDVTQLTPDKMRDMRRHIQMIFQDPYASLNPRLHAWDLVSEPLKVHGGYTREQRRERAAQLLERVNLPREFLDRYAHQFSGGQRQRLCIARALSVNPKIIVADEPVSALDVSVQARVLDLMKELQAEMGLSYLFISHDMAVVEKVSHRVAVMVMGQIVEIGPTQEVLHRPRHPYTQSLLSAVPIPDPARRHQRTMRAAREIPSPIRKVGNNPHVAQLVQVAPGHFVQQAA